MMPAVSVFFFSPGIREQCHWAPHSGPGGDSPHPQAGLLGKTIPPLASPRVSCSLRRAHGPTPTRAPVPDHLRCETTCFWGPVAVLQEQPGLPATRDVSVLHDIFLLILEGRAESAPRRRTSSNQPETKKPLLRNVLEGRVLGTGKRRRTSLPPHIK